MLKIWNSYNSIADKQRTDLSYVSSKEPRHTACKYNSSLQSDFILERNLDIYKSSGFPSDVEDGGTKIQDMLYNTPRSWQA